MNNSFLTYQKKRYLVVLVLALLFFVAHKKIFKVTVKEIKSYHQKKNENIDSISINADIEVVKQEIKQLDVILGDETFNEKTLQSDILQFLSHHKRDRVVSVASLEKTHRFTSDNITIITNNLTIQGPYNDLIEIVYVYEQFFTSSKITSVKMFKKTTNKKQSDELFAQILFQNYRYM